jgi:hypothetical protein
LFGEALIPLLFSALVFAADADCLEWRGVVFISPEYLFVCSLENYIFDE